MSFYTNIENNDYLMIKKEDLYLITNINLNKEQYREIISILNALKHYSREHNFIYIDEFALHKNNIISQFLLTENKKIVNDDLEINLLKSSNALCISILEDDPISKEILPIFKNRVSGNKYDLISKYDSNTLDYILNNSDFNYHIKKTIGNYTPKFYIVYEDGKCVERKLIDDNLYKNKNLT